MKTMHEINVKKVPVVRIDHSLDKYDKVVLFPENLAKSNENIELSGSPVEARVRKTSEKK